MENAPRANIYAADCVKCGQQVEPGRGIVQRTAGRWVVEHQSCPGTVRLDLQDRFDSEFIGWIGKMILEEGSIDAARLEYEACNEYWDGEPELRASGLARFDAAVPYAVRQNELIHGRR